MTDGWERDVNKNNVSGGRLQCCCRCNRKSDHS